MKGLNIRFFLLLRKRSTRIQRSMERNRYISQSILTREKQLIFVSNSINKYSVNKRKNNFMFKNKLQRNIFAQIQRYRNFGIFFRKMSHLESETVYRLLCFTNLNQ